MSEIQSKEGLILHGLIYNDHYCRKVIPFLKAEYFQEHYHKIIFEKTEEHLTKYNTQPTKEALIIEIEASSGVSDEAYAQCIELLDELHLVTGKTENDEYLSDMTEGWVQDSAFFNVMLEATEVIDGDRDKVSKSGIPDKMSQALAISFDNSVGHQFIGDAEERYDYYHKKETRIKFGLDMFNKITKGGLPTKTLTCLMSSNTGGFKSGTMCSMAADNMRLGDDVLVITCEMSQERWAERVDANLMDVELDDLAKLGKATYMKKIEAIKKKCAGKLVIKEYPTATAHAGHFRFLLKELKQKHNFVPKIVYVDYLNICASQRLPSSAVANSYLYIKSVAEELRALATEFNIAVVTATQGGRQVAGASNVEISDVSESYGLPATCDLFLGVITTEELDDLGQIMYKQLKNRFGDIALNRSFVLGVAKAKMQLFDVSNNYSGMTSTPTPSGSTGGLLPSSSQDTSTKGKFDSFQI